MTIHRFTISIWFYCTQQNDGAKKEVYQNLEQLKHCLKHELENARIFLKCCGYWENTVLQLIRFFTSVPDIAGFTDEPVVQCHVQVFKNTSVDDSKYIIQMINKCIWFQINFYVKLI